MRWLVSCSLLSFMTAAQLSAQTMNAQDILNRPELTDLEGQTIDANSALLEALRRAALKPAKFETNSTSLSLDAEVGAVAQATVRLRNSGGVAAEVYSVVSVGSFDGLTLEHDCPPSLGPGEYCDIEISFASERPRTLSSAIVATVNGDGQSELRIPFEIEITAPPVVEEVPEPAPVIIQIPDPVPVAPQGPTSEDLARRYFGSMGGMMPARNHTERGFSIVTADPVPPAPEFAGVLYNDMAVETVTTQDRYGDEVASTESSLPVNRDRIVTADRVIKAVLETPVSNIMCGKVVALVESDVYSATSRVPLIQAGSRVVGECGEFIGARAGVEWTRIITTDGRSISFELGADTRDATGMGGAIGRVHTSTFDRYVLPVISTVIDSTAGVIMATFGEDEKVVIDENGNAVSDKSAKNEGIRIVTGEARGTAQQIIKDIREVRAVSVIPAGSRIDIEISEDIYFTESRKVVRLADMTFDLKDIERGDATRDLPQNLTLKPAEVGYSGPTMMVDGRLYKVEKSIVLDDRGRPIVEDEISSEMTLDELAGFGSE